MEEYLLAVLLVVLLGLMLLYVRRTRRQVDLMKRLGVEPVPEEETRTEPAWTPREPIPSGLLGPLHRKIRQGNLSVRAMDIVAAGVLLAVIAGTASWLWLESTFWSAVAAALAGTAPFVEVSRRASARISKVETQLADALDVVVSALHAGVGVRQSFETIRQEMKPPISEEFADLLARMEFGTPPAVALREWARELDSKYISMLAVILAAKWEVGGNLADVLMSVSNRIRENIRMRRRVRALTGEARVTAVVAFVAPYAIALYFWFFRPGHVEFLWTDPRAQKFLHGAILLQILGGIWIWRLMKSVRV